MAFPQRFWLRNLWHWNKPVLYLVIVSQAIYCDIVTKKKASIILFALGKDVHCVFFGTVVYFIICFWVATSKDKRLLQESLLQWL